MPFVVAFDCYTSVPSSHSTDMDSATPSGARLPMSMTAVGVFLVFGACMSGLAGTTLVWQGTTLDKVWGLNPTAYRRLAPLGTNVGPLFLLLSATMFIASVGWFKRRRWGWGLALGIISTQITADTVNLVRGDYLRGGTGLTIAGALLYYLLHPKVRNTFRPVNRSREA